MQHWWLSRPPQVQRSALGEGPSCQDLTRAERSSDDRRQEAARQTRAPENKSSARRGYANNVFAGGQLRPSSRMRRLGS